MQNEPIEVTFKVTAVFEQLHVPYLIGGSLASVSQPGVADNLVSKMLRPHEREANCVA